MTYYKYFLKSIKSFKWYNVSCVHVIQYVTFLSFYLCKTQGQIPLTPTQESKKGLFCMFTNQTCCEQIFFSSLSPHPSYFFGPMMGLNKAYQWIVRNVFVDMACIFNTVGNKNSKKPRLNGNTNNSKYIYIYLQRYTIIQRCCCILMH